MLKAFFQTDLIEAGCDEAGRGCLAGPVVAAAVVLPKDFSHDLLNDSKQLNEKQRDLLRKEIENVALDYAVTFIDHEEIDEINILNASYKAMDESVRKLKREPGLLLIDGNRFKTKLKIPYECIVKGDGKFYSIAAASILAKTYRDEFMYGIHEKFPCFDWKSNKGYPTKNHRDAIKENGISPYHRKSFALLSKARQMEMF